MSRGDEIMREHLRRNLAAVCAEKTVNPTADQRAWLEELEELARLAGVHSCCTNANDVLSPAGVQQTSKNQV